MSPTTLPYKPQRSSSAGRVCAFFAAHPKDTMTAADIAEAYDLLLRDVPTLLAPAVTTGLLVKAKNAAGFWEYAAGPFLSLWADELQPSAPIAKPASGALSQIPTPAPAAKKPGSARRYGRLPELDISKVKVETNVAPPTRQQRGMSRYTEFFALLKAPGQSAPAPLAYQAALSKAWRDYAKHHAAGARFRVTVCPLDASKCRVFREA